MACYEMKYNVVGKVSSVDDCNNFRLAMTLTYYIKWMIGVYSPEVEDPLQNGSIIIEFLEIIHYNCFMLFRDLAVTFSVAK